MDEVRHLVGDDEAAGASRRENQAPTQANPARRGAAAPTASRIADVDRRDRYACFKRDSRAFGRQNFESPGLQKRRDLSLDPGEGPAASKLPVSVLRNPGPC